VRKTREFSAKVANESMASRRCGRYTNAGKSLSELLTGADLVAENKLFATWTDQRAALCCQTNSEFF